MCSIAPFICFLTVYVQSVLPTRIMHARENEVSFSERPLGLSTRGKKSYRKDVLLTHLLLVAGKPLRCAALPPRNDTCSITWLENAS
jgi:hypothetical protein